jgi:hypothetical protein
VKVQENLVDLKELSRGLEEEFQLLLRALEGFASIKSTVIAWHNSYSPAK